MEDLQAIRRLKRGDMGGLECLIARYQEKALRTAFLVTHDEPMAEDIVQDPDTNKHPNAMLTLINPDNSQLIPVPNLSGYVTSWLP